MAWLAICIPLMLVGVLIAIIPLCFATHHQHKYGHHGSYPDRQTARRSAATSTAGVSTCPTCTALVADQAIHESSVHAAVA
jgi:hypothetical protein